MDSLIQTLLSQLSGDTLSTITSQLGIDQGTAEKAIGLALPVLIGSLNRNSASTDGAQALTQALARDHDGSILENLAGNLGRKEVVEDGQAILGHVLGERQQSVSSNLSQASGLDSGQIVQLMAMLAPVVLGALGKMQRQKSLDAQGVASLLTQEREQATSQLPALAQLLDMDGDGNVTEEVINLGGNLLRGLFSKK